MDNPTLPMMRMSSKEKASVGEVMSACADRQSRADLVGPDAHASRQVALILMSSADKGQTPQLTSDVTSQVEVHSIPDPC